MELAIRPVTADELTAFAARVLDTFGTDPDGDPQAPDRLRALVPPGRAFAAFDGDALVATAAAYAMRLSVPGGAIAMGGLTCVTVAPSHQRRGLLRRLMATHLADVAAAGEPVSGLYASQGALYRRFGYGVAAEGEELSVRGPLTAPATPDALALLSTEDAHARLPAIDRAVAPTRAGMYVRDDDWWRWRRIADRPLGRAGRSARRFLVATRAGVDVGYAIYRQRPGFTDGQASGVIDLEELIACDARAEATLWHALSTMDLFPTVEYDNAPVDHALALRATDPRRVVRRRRRDTLWLRLLDVPAALTARRYRADGAVVLELAAPDRPPERLALRVVDGAATVEPTAATPDAHLDVADLAALYLGGTRAADLAAADRLRGAPAAVALLDALFAWPSAPWCAEQF